MQPTQLFVHEDLEAHHEVGQAKFLEQPARERQGELKDIVESQLRAGRTVGQALLVAGLTLQGWAQELAPVLTGNLRGSAYTLLVPNVPNAAPEASATP